MLFIIFYPSNQLFVSRGSTGEGHKDGRAWSRAGLTSGLSQALLALGSTFLHIGKLRKPAHHFRGSASVEFGNTPFTFRIFYEANVYNSTAWLTYQTHRSGPWLERTPVIVLNTCPCSDQKILRLSSIMGHGECVKFSTVEELRYWEDSLRAHNHTMFAPRDSLADMWAQIGWASCSRLHRQ